MVSDHGYTFVRMFEQNLYRQTEVILPSTGAPVVSIVAPNGQLHKESNQWIDWMGTAGHRGSGMSPNTIKFYAQRMAWFMSWITLTKDWRDVTVNDLRLFMNTLTSTPTVKTNGQSARRSASTVNLYMVAVRSFLTWAKSNELLHTDVVRDMTELKYYPAGSPGGGEHGRERLILIQELKAKAPESNEPPKWIEEAQVRQQLLLLPLNPRDRFLIDLIYCTGIRIGEALSLFDEDLHFGGGSPELSCRFVDPHFHVKLGNPTENRARAKGGPRTLFVSQDIVSSYLEYHHFLHERLTDQELARSRHVFVNFGEPKGKAMTYSNADTLMERLSRKLNYYLTGQHILRHTYATIQINGLDGYEKASVSTVARQLGHAGLASTEVYSHADWNAQKEAAQAMTLPRFSTTDSTNGADQ